MILTLFIWMVAIGLLVVAVVRNQGEQVRGLLFARETLVRLVPIIIMAVITAGFVGQLIPGEVIAGALGGEGGLASLFLAAGLGVVTLGGPVVAFSLAAVFLHGGAGIGPLVAFLTSWSIFSLHQTLAYEVPMAGWRPAVARVLSAGWVPLVAGTAAGVASRYVVIHMP